MMISKASPLLLLLVLYMYIFSLSVLSKPNEQVEFLKNLEGSNKGKNLEGVQKLKQYLKKFGYLHYDEKHSAHANDDDFDEILEAAVQTYQLNYNLEVSGSLDSRTVNQMMKPRCGVPDIINGTTRMQLGKKKHQQGPLSLPTVSLFSFFPRHQRWPADKTHLTYRFYSSVQVVPLQILRPVISSAFSTWAAVSMFSFAEAQPGFHSDIVIGFHRGAHGDNLIFDGPGHILAHAYAPTDGRFHYDADENWSTNPNINEFDLESLAVHEIGHLLGLEHSWDPNAVMVSTIGGGFIKRDLVTDDIQGIQTLYNL